MTDFYSAFYEDMLVLENDNPDAFAAVTIDKHNTDEDKPGQTICKIWMTKHGDIITDWRKNAYRLHSDVTKLVHESIDLLHKNFSAKET